MRRSGGARRILRGLLLVLLVLEGAYLAAANLYLNSPLIRKTINRRPEKFRLEWRSAWTLYPGMVTLRQVEVRGRSRRVEWHAHLDAVGTRFRLRPLFQRTVHLSGTRASGVAYRQMRRLLPGEILRGSAADLPSLPPLPDEPVAGGDAGNPRKPPGRPWTVIADDIACQVEELWFDRFRLAGPLRVETPMRLAVHGEMEFPRVRARMASGQLLAGKGVIFDALALDIDATVHPFVPKSARGPALFRQLSGRFALRSPSASLFFLEAYFRKAPWLHFNERAGGSAVLVLDHGRLRPGTALDVSNDRVNIEFLDRRLTGLGVIRGRVETIDGAPRSRITARLPQFELSPIGSTTPFARGRDASLEATSRAVDLANPFTDLQVVFDLPEATILELAFYNQLIPPGSRFRLLSGTGTLRYHLEGSQEERSLHGDIELAVPAAAARFESFEMHGGFTLRTRLREASPRELLFDISGTRLDLHAARPPWTATITFPRARMSLADPIRIEAALRLALQDTRPLVAMFDALRGVPAWLERMMTIENVRGGAELDVRRDRVGVSNLEVDGKGLRALADLVLGRNSREGILYLRFHGLSVGIQLEEGGKDLKLFRPLAWYQKERARRRAADRPTPR